MAAGMLQADPLPSYYQCGCDIYSNLRKYIYSVDSDYLSWPTRFYKDVAQLCSATQGDLILVLALGMFWTLLRFLLSKLLFLPMGHWFRLQKANLAKFPESAWKSLFYGCTWGYSFYLLVYSGKYDYFYRPVHIWEGWTSSLVVPTEIYIAYAVQFSFYLHGVFATIFMDAWRKDSLVMIFHHFLTMALIGFSFASKYHKIGLVVLFLHDIADVCLEFTKCNVYFKNRNGKFYAIHDHISTVGFLAFASSWAWFRLYWFPLKVLYSTGYGVVVHGPEQLVPFYFFFNVLLWVLQVLNIYWFTFILNFLFKVATGQMKEVDDVRENEVLEKTHRSPKSVVAGNEKGNNAVNGFSPQDNATHEKAE